MKVSISFDAKRLQTTGLNAIMVAACTIVSIASVVMCIMAFMT